MTDASSDQTIESLKTPPFSVEAEQSILGGLMLENEAWFNVTDLVSETDFYRHEHQILFRAIKSLTEEGRPCDVITLSEWLVIHNQLDAIGGLSYLEQIYKNTPSAANIVAYAEIVRERSILRQLIKVGQDIANSAYYPQGRSSMKLLDNAESVVFEIAEQQGTQKRKGFIQIGELTYSTLERIDLLSNQEGEVTGVPTGFKDFDELTSGLQRSDLIIVAGRPSMGKCITGDAKIALADGSLVTIKELCHRQQAQLLTLDDDETFYLTEPTAFINSGIQPVCRVTTQLGREIETTLTHPFLTHTGWKPLSEIAVGQKIAVPRQLNLFGTTTLPDYEVKLLSYWLGQDPLKKNNLIHLPPLIKEDFKIAMTQFDDNTGEKREKYREFIDVAHSSNQSLPPIIFTLARPQLALFLNRLFATRGQVKLTQKGALRLHYLHHSDTLVKNVQHLLLRFGILAIVNNQTRSRFPRWELQIKEPQSLFNFINQIGICSESTLDLSILQKLTNLSQSDHFKETTEIYWDKITAIEPQGNKEVFDLTIPYTHNFVANDICVHNTSFAMNIAEYVAVEKKIPVGVFSMEMSSEQLMMRLFSSTARVNLQRIRTGKNLEDDDWAKLERARQKLQEAPLFIDESPAFNPYELRVRVRRLAREQGQLGLIVVDYLQLMQVPDNKENRATEVSEISRSFKSLAKELNVPIIALSQLNRSLEQRPDKRPRMSDLRESGSIEQDADLIVFIYRDEVYNEDSPDKGTAEVIIAKQRNGPTGAVRLTFAGQYTKFENHASNSYYNE